MLFGKQINLQPHYLKVPFFLISLKKSQHFCLSSLGGKKNNKSELNITKYHSGIQNPA